MNIVLTFSVGFSWYKQKGISVKGYLFDSRNIFFEKENLINYFADIYSVEDFERKIRKANGCFAVVIKRENIVLASVDRLRSIPLFYSIINDEIMLTDSVEEIKRKYNLNNFDPVSEAEYKCTGFVTHNKTLFNEVKQLQVGEYLYIKNNALKTKYYYHHFADCLNDNNRLDYFVKLEQIAGNVFKRLISSVKGRTIIIPLSAGLDSRFIVSMLRHLGYQKVICFTYGDPDGWEIKTSRQIARKLGYDWHYVEYNKDLFGPSWKEDIINFGLFSSNFVSLPHVQDLYAVRELKKRNVIPDEAVFVPGHTGDLISGKQITTEVKKVQANINLFNIAELISQKHYYLNSVMLDEFREKFVSRISEYCAQSPSLFSNNIFNLLDAWNVANRQAKFILNSARVYEYLGHEWRLPLWDNELVDFFESLPLSQRMNASLYTDYLFKKVFPKFDITFYNRKQQIGNFIKRVAPSFYAALIKTIGYNNISSSKMYRALVACIKDDSKENHGKESNGIYFNHNFTPWFIKELKNALKAKNKRVLHDD